MYSIKKENRVLKAFLREIRLWFEHFFIKNIPGSIGLFVRRSYWSLQFGQSSLFDLGPGCLITEPSNIFLGKMVRVMQNCHLFAHNNGIIKMGDRSVINYNVQLGAADNGEIILGSDVAIGPNVVLRASNHAYKKKDLTISEQGHTGGKIIIEDDVWIGANAVILPDVTIGRGSVIGAGAVVNKHIPPYSLAGGVPAVVIRENCRS